MLIKNLISKLGNLFNKKDMADDDMEREKSIFIVDIGSSQLKVMLGVKNGRDLIIKNFNKIISPSGMSRLSYHESIESEMQMLETKIEIMLETFSAESDYLVTCLPDNFSIIKLISLEETPDEKELDEVLKKNIEGDLPHAYEKWEFTTDIVDKTDSGVNMIVLATLRENLELVTDTISESLAEPDYVSCSSFLSHEALYPYLESKGSANVALVNMGNTATSVSIFKGSHLRFMQNVCIGGYNFTLDIANAMQISTSEAESFKKSELFFLPEYVAQQDKVKNYLIVKSTFMELARGIFYFFESYFTKYFEEKIDEIVIYGGGANFKNIEITLGGMLNIPVKKASSIIKAKYADGREVEDDMINLCVPMLGAVCGGFENEDKS